MKDELLSKIDALKNEFVELIHQRFGMVIQDHQISTLVKTITEACHKFNCTPDYYLEQLRKCPENSPYFEHVVNGITVGETYFFRDKRQIAVLKETILPQLIFDQYKKKCQRLRIWSAACSTGPEIYTIAILLLELLPDIKRWSVSLLGTDVNVKALETAMAGVYGKWALRSVTDQQKELYFTKVGNEYILSPRIREMVKFQPLNLIDASYPSILNGTSEQNLILCRNVLIYFNNETVLHIMKNLCASLAEGGILMLGASDPHTTAGTDLITHRTNGIYFSRPVRPPVIVPVVPVLSEYPKAVPMAKQPKKVFSKEQIEELLRKRQWSAALEALSHFTVAGEQQFILRSKAQAWTNLGDLEKAASLYEQSLAANMTDRNTYFLYACTLVGLNRYNEAEKALKQALFLDHQFIAGHYKLGLLLIKDQREQSVKSLNNALLLAESKNPDDPVEGMADVSCGLLIQIIKTQLQTLAMVRINDKI